MINIILVLLVMAKLTQTDDQFKHSLYLDPNENYKMSWLFDKTDITIQVEVKAKGWIGWGLSANGDMKGSDIVVGYMQNQQPVLNDMHGVKDQNTWPVKDESQDYELLKWNKTADLIIMKFKRKRVLCNAHDRAITEDTQRIIWAYGDGDFRYHNTNRGTHSVLLIDYADQKNTEKLPANVENYTLRMNNDTLANDTTMYMCKSMSAPKLAGKRHLIRVEPIVQEGHETLVHHVLLYACHRDFNASLVDQQHHCKSDNMPNDLRICRGMSILIHAWAIGGTTFNYPSEAGMSFGAAGDPDILLMEMHYDNPKATSGLQDISGLRLYLTSDIRPNEVGIITAGQSVSPFTQIIPPQEESFKWTGFCTSKCLQTEKNPVKPKIFATFLHAHLQGRKIVVRLVRESDGVEVKRISQDLTYDFNFQEVKTLPDLIEIPPGHSIHVECTYNTMNYHIPVVGGSSTKDEMCMAFLWHYPINSNALWCMSNPTFPILPDFAEKELGWPLIPFPNSTIYYQIAKNLTLDGHNRKGQWINDAYRSTAELWKDKEVGKKWQNYALLPEYTPLCSGTGERNTGGHLRMNWTDIHKPKLTKKLPADACDNKAPSPSPVTTMTTDSNETSMACVNKSSFIILMIYVITSIVIM